MIRGRTLVPGAAAGPVVAIAPLSFWGGFDPESGCVTDRSHPACGVSLAGTILVMRAGRGSSSSSSVFAEAVRRGTAPAGVVLVQADAVLSVGAQVAATLYGRQCPVVSVAADDHAWLSGRPWLAIVADAERAEIDLAAPGDQPSTKKNPSANRQ